MVGFSSKGQSYLPPLGAEWHYETRHAWSPHTSYALFRASDWVVKGGDTALQVDILGPYPACHYYGGDTSMYFKEDSGKIYLYDAYADTFRVYVDFSMPVGGAWKAELLNGHPSSPYTDTVFWAFTVIEIDTVWIDGYPLRKLKCSIDSTEHGTFNPGLTIEFVERIISFDYISLFSIGHCDVYLANGLRCYTDSSISYQVHSYPCDTTWAKINEPDAHTNWSLYPNPAHHQIKIESSEFIEAYRLYNAAGQVMLSANDLMEQDLGIDVNELPDGVYTLQIVSGEAVSCRKLLITR